MTSPVPIIDVDKNLGLQTRVAEITIVTAELFLSNKFFYWPSKFLEIQNTNGSDFNSSSWVYIWGDVLKGVEEMSHNVTAALLTLPLGTMDAQCFSDYQAEVYRYRSFVLWAAYGVGRFSFLSCHNLTFFPLCFIDGLGHCSTFTNCCRQDNGEEQHCRYHKIIFEYGYFTEERE
jgi:hypothetical protein